jgi:hypothetical protein
MWQGRWQGDDSLHTSNATHYDVMVRKRTDEVRLRTWVAPKKYLLDFRLPQQ